MKSFIVLKKSDSLSDNRICSAQIHFQCNNLIDFRMQVCMSGSAQVFYSVSKHYDFLEIQSFNQTVNKSTQEVCFPSAATYNLCAMSASRLKTIF